MAQERRNLPASVEASSLGRSRQPVTNERRRRDAARRQARLVDREIGSGAEVVAAALQDNHRGIVVGSRTAGRAHADLPIRVADGIMKVTVAFMHRANGTPSKE